MKNKPTVKHRPAPRVLLLEVESEFVSAKYHYNDTLTGNITLRSQMKRLKENHIHLVRQRFFEDFSKKERYINYTKRTRFYDHRKRRLALEERKQKEFGEIFKKSPLKVKVQILDPNSY